MSRKVILSFLFAIALVFCGCKADNNVNGGSNTQGTSGFVDDNKQSPEATKAPDPTKAPESVKTLVLPSEAPNNTEENTNQNTDTDPDSSDNVYRDVTYEVRGRVHSDMPEYRFVATGKTRGTEAYDIGFVMGLKVYNEKDRVILSANLSEIDGDEIYGYAVYNEMMDTMGLHLVDVNFDGYKDVIILNTFSGAHSNTWYDCWLWDQELSLFVSSRSFADICNPSIDPEKKCIYSTGGSGAAYWGGSIYQFIDGEFVMTNDLYTDWGGLKETALVNGEMTVVREVIYPDDEEKAAEIEAAEKEYYAENELWQLNHPRWYWYGGHHADEWIER